MKRRLSLFLVLATPLLFAQAQEAPVTVTFNQQHWAGELVIVGAIPGSGWQSTEVKNPHSGSVLRLLSTKEGQSRLKWQLGPFEQAASLELHKAKAPADLQGNISMENSGTLVVFTQSPSVSLDELKAHLALLPGYYAVRLRSNRFPSDWMTIRIR